MKTSNELENIEIQLLLQAIFRYWGFDFRNYAPASLRRRIWNVIRSEQLTSISGLQEKVLHDSACLERFLQALSVNVTGLFRNPSFFLAFKEQVVPRLRTYPLIRIWHAGCATGEEVYSVAILLQEAGLYHRCRIYATDMNQRALDQARAGVFSLPLIQTSTQNYFQAGGQQSFSQYYTTASDQAIFSTSLKKNLVFSQHNLATDGSFNEFNLIFCRNVLIYFNPLLQARVHHLLYESLCRFGILGLGRQESLKLTLHEKDYRNLAGHEKLYQRVG